MTAQSQPQTEAQSTKASPDQPPPLVGSEFERTAAPSDRGDSIPTPAPADADELQRLYRQMFLIRRVEEECARAYAQGKIGGFLHLYIGQESVGVGSIAALRPDDYVVGTYRDHGLAIAKGMSAKAVLAELFGKVTGCSKGLGGSMHLFDVPNGMLGGYGIVGGHIPLAVGTAYASKYRGDGRVTLCYFGDGSVTIGSFHEAVSLAALWKLPVVFICENNEYSMGTPLHRSLSLEDVSVKADGYGIPRDRFIARDVLDVKARIGVAIERARSTGMPTLVEVRTYRFRGHSMSDPGKYRTPEEIEAQKKLDPLSRARKQLSQLGRSEEQLAALEAEVEAEVQEAVRFADESPEPQPDILEPTTYIGPFAR